MDDFGKEDDQEKAKKFKSRLQANLEQKHRGKRDTREIVIKCETVKPRKPVAKKFEVTIDTVEETNAETSYNFTTVHRRAVRSRQDSIWPQNIYATPRNARQGFNA